MLIPSEKLRIALVTISRHEEAVQLIQTLMSEQLIYLGVISPPLYSLLGWHGMVRESKEHIILLLTSTEQLEPLGRRIDELHPSDSPLFLSWALSEVSPAIATIVTSNWQEE